MLVVLFLWAIAGGVACLQSQLFQLSCYFWAWFTPRKALVGFTRWGNACHLECACSVVNWGSLSMGEPWSPARLFAENSVQLVIICDYRNTQWFASVDYLICFAARKDSRGWDICKTTLGNSKAGECFGRFEGKQQWCWSIWGCWLGWPFQQTLP
jgi:hypothetical protein